MYLVSIFLLYYSLSEASGLNATVKLKSCDKICFYSSFVVNLQQNWNKTDELY